MQQKLVAAQSELAAAKAQLDLMQRAERDAGEQARVAADTAAKQGQALKEAGQRDEALTLDLEAARRVIKGLQAKNLLSDEARHSMADSLAQANRALDEERNTVELSEHELTLARQASDANKTSADLAAAKRANAEKGRQVAEAALKQAGDALKQAGDALKLERARTDSAARDLDAARQERDAAKQASEELSAALEQAREKVVRMAINLSAARKAIELVKAQSVRRIARIKQGTEARVAAGPLASQPARQPGLQEKNKKVQKSSKRVLVATTITLPDALLPTPQGP
ncbi:hypothetical protein ACWGTO_16790 [Mesorhizobium sp. PL10]